MAEAVPEMIRLGVHMTELLCRQSLDRFEIRELIDNWVVWRDTGDWERFGTLWHDEGRMVTTWCEVSAQEFIGLCKKAWAGGSIHATHFLGGTSIELAGERAVAHTKMLITQRAPLHGVTVDVICSGRFYDLLERRNERWALVLRHPIYEMDRIESVDPSVSLKLDQNLLNEMPYGYRHLAYLQTALGLKVNRCLPCKTGPEIERLLERGRSWLANGTAD